MQKRSSSRSLCRKGDFDATLPLFTVKSREHRDQMISWATDYLDKLYQCCVEQVTAMKLDPDAHWRWLMRRSSQIYKDFVAEARSNHG